MLKSLNYSILKNNLKYLVPAAAVTTLFLVGCGDDDVVEAADYPCEGTTGNEALLGGSWKLTKEDGGTISDSLFTNEDGDQYAYSLIYAFECGGDFDIKEIYTYTDDEQNPIIYEYEGSWDFTAADGTIGISWESDDFAYEWDFDIESVSETILKGTLYTESNTTALEFEKI